MNLSLMVLACWLQFTEPQPLPGAIPPDAKPLPGRSWASNPLRQTKGWNDLVSMCDDPDCAFCREHVYGLDNGRIYKIRYGR